MIRQVLDEGPDPASLREQSRSYLPIVVDVVIGLGRGGSRERRYRTQGSCPCLRSDPTKEGKEQPRQSGDAIKVGTRWNDPGVKGVFRGGPKKELSCPGRPTSGDLFVRVIGKQYGSLTGRRIPVGVSGECRNGIDPTERDAGGVGQEGFDLQSDDALIRASKVFPRRIDDVGNPVIKVPADVVPSLDGIVGEICSGPLETVLIVEQTDRDLYAVE